MAGALPLAARLSPSPERQRRPDRLPRQRRSGSQVGVAVGEGRRSPQRRARAGPGQTVGHARDGGEGDHRREPPQVAPGAHQCARGKDRRDAQDLLQRAGLRPLVE